VAQVPETGLDGKVEHMSTIHENGNVADDDMAASTSRDGGVESGLKVWADVGLTIGRHVEELGSKIDRLNRLWANLEANTPVDYQSVASGVFVTGTPLILNLGSPDIGTYWEVTGVAVGGLEINVTAAGAPGLYVSAVPTLAGAGLANVSDFWASMPAMANYGTRQLVVKDQESLFFVIFGGTNGQTYVANASVTVFPVGSAKGGVEITA